MKKIVSIFLFATTKLLSFESQHFEKPPTIGADNVKADSFLFRKDYTDKANFQNDLKDFLNFSSEPSKSINLISEGTNFHGFIVSQIVDPSSKLRLKPNDLFGCHIPLPGEKNIKEVLYDLIITTLPGSNLENAKVGKSKKNQVLMNQPCRDNALRKEYKKKGDKVITETIDSKKIPVLFSSSVDLEGIDFNKIQSFFSIYKEREGEHFSIAFHVVLPNTIKISEGMDDYFFQLNEERKLKMVLGIAKAAYVDFDLLKLAAQKGGFDSNTSFIDCIPQTPSKDLLARISLGLFWGEETKKIPISVNRKTKIKNMPDKFEVEDGLMHGKVVAQAIDVFDKAKARLRDFFGALKDPENYIISENKHENDTQKDLVQLESNIFNQLQNFTNNLSLGKNLENDNKQDIKEQSNGIQIGTSYSNNNQKQQTTDDLLQNIIFEEEKKSI